MAMHRILYYRAPKGLSAGWTKWKDTVLALAQAQHPRVGINPHAQILSSDVLQKIYSDFLPAPWSWLNAATKKL